MIQIIVINLLCMTYCCDHQARVLGSRFISKVSTPLSPIRSFGVVFLLLLEKNNILFLEAKRMNANTLVENHPHFIFPFFLCQGWKKINSSFTSITSLKINHLYFLINAYQHYTNHQMTVILIKINLCHLHHTISCILDKAEINC